MAKEYGKEDQITTSETDLDIEESDTSYLEDLMSGYVKEAKEKEKSTNQSTSEDKIESKQEVVRSKVSKDSASENAQMKRRAMLFKSMGYDTSEDDIVSSNDTALQETISEKEVESKDDTNNSPENSASESSINGAKDTESNNNSQESKDDKFTKMMDVMFESESETAPEKEIGDNVVVPLETPEMKEVKVTADGKTLADMLPGMRGGRKTVGEVVSSIKSREKTVKVGNKEFSDNRYTKHIDEIEKEKKEQDRRRALSKKFLQRNAKFSEEEKIIMENLGITNEGFAKLMASTELTKKDKEEVLGLGRYGAERHFKGRRYRTTVGDTAMLEFLTKFKFANTRILRWISNEPQGRTWRKLNRLRNNGLVESQTLIGIPDLWAATRAGVGISGYDLDPGLRPMPKMTTVSSTMGINYIAACLWFNSINVLNLEDFPAHNRVISLQEDGRERARGEMLVSELEIRSSLGKEINPQSTTMQTLGDEKLYDIISDNVRKEVEAWEAGGRVGNSPELKKGNEYMWILFPKSQLTLSYHVPDLVVVRERGKNGEPKSIAVEMERYDKTSDKYDKIMLAYKLDKHLYEKVVWITPNSRVARALEQAAKNVGFENYAILPIITETGVYTKPDIWMI